MSLTRSWPWSQSAASALPGDGGPIAARDLRLRIFHREVDAKGAVARGGIVNARRAGARDHAAGRIFPYRALVFDGPGAAAGGVHQVKEVGGEADAGSECGDGRVSFRDAVKRPSSSPPRRACVATWALLMWKILSGLTMI